MKNYKEKFKGYLKSLGARKPAPGGGSAACLVFCIGISLIEKAASYSVVLKPKDSRQSAQNKKLKKIITSLKALKIKVYPYIDKDGQVFEKVMASKGKKRLGFVKQSNRIITDTIKASESAFLLAKEAKSGIKSSIISDFNTGLGLIKSAVNGCRANLKANKTFFEKK